MLYGGSLVNLMEPDLGPKFQVVTGDRFLGVGVGSSELTNEIKGKTRVGDVFISASPNTNASLEGTANGGWVSWHVTLAKAPLVIGYDSHSWYAAALKAKPWYQVITESGFRLGYTDPKLDPKSRGWLVSVVAERRLHL